MEFVERKYYDLLREQSQKHPDKPALVMGEKCLTYSEFVGKIEKECRVFGYKDRLYGENLGACIILQPNATGKIDQRTLHIDMLKRLRKMELNDELEKGVGGNASLILNEVVLWDQTRDEIIVNHDTWDDKKIFCSMWGMITNRLFKASHLRDNGIRFDESIECAEDYPFMIEALWKAKKVCLLPQLIGYVYYVNSASILQSSGNKGEGVVLATARSFKKVIDYCLSYGIDLNDSMHMFLMFVAGIMLSNGQISDGVCNEVFDLITPYAKLLTPLPPSKL